MKWVTAWGNAQSITIPHPHTYTKNLTLRYPIFMPFNGNKIRIELDNICCDEDVLIDSVYAAIGNSLSDLQSNPINVTFNNSSSVLIKAHQKIKSDEINININSDEYLIISLYLKDYTKLVSGVDITGPLSKGYFAYGNQATFDKLDINTSKSTSWVYFLSNVDVYTEDNNYAVICYGDSITSQDWPDYMLKALRENNVKNISVIRKAISGTRILRQYDCILYQSYGLKGDLRFNHEISSVSGAKKLIIQHGINDIIHPVGEDINIFRPLSDLPTTNDLIEGIKYYLNEAKKYNLDIYLGTLLPIYGWRTFNLEKEQIKNEFNTWIKSNKHIDFQNEIGTFVNNAYQFNAGCDSGDHLHPSKHAYKLMGELAAKTIIKQE